jgi:hypothetical protein
MEYEPLNQRLMKLAVSGILWPSRVIRLQPGPSGLKGTDTLGIFALSIGIDVLEKRRSFKLENTGF